MTAEATNATDLGFTIDGIPIAAVKAIVNKTGDGLSKAVDVEPVIVEAGGRAYLAVEVVKTRDRYDYEKNEDGNLQATHVQVFDAKAVTFIDNATVRMVLDASVAKIKAAEALRKSGQLTLDMTDEEPHPSSLPEGSAARAQAGDIADKVDDAIGTVTNIGDKKRESK